MYEQARFHYSEVLMCLKEVGQTETHYLADQTCILETPREQEAASLHTHQKNAIEIPSWNAHCLPGENCLDLFLLENLI